MQIHSPLTAQFLEYSFFSNRLIYIHIYPLCQCTVYIGISSIGQLAYSSAAGLVLLHAYIYCFMPKLWLHATQFTHHKNHFPDPLQMVQQDADLVKAAYIEHPILRPCTYCNYSNYEGCVMPWVLFSSRILPSVFI